MHELREALSNISELREESLSRLMREGNSPDVVFAALLSIFDSYTNPPECHWLYDFSMIAIDRVFRLIGAASGEDEEAIRAMLYRAVVDYVSEHRSEIYADHEDQLPSSFEVEEAAHAPEERGPFPIINLPPSQNGLTSNFQQFSALKMFGYTVGKTAGWTESERQSFLTYFMENELPGEVAEHFGSEYGDPITTIRLRKVANVIASNCGLRLRNDPQRYGQAISDWIADLDFLKSRYYDQLELKFYPWPDPYD